MSRPTSTFWPSGARIAGASRLARRGAVAAAALTLCTVLAPLSMPGAQATPFGLGACLEYDLNMYQPGVTFTAKPTHISSSGVLGPCLSLTDPTLTAGSYQGSGTGSVSCTGGTFEGTVTYHWNNGRQSTISYKAVIGTRLVGETVVAYRGRVTAGEFTGFDYTSPITALNLAPLNCLSPQGVTSTAGPSVSLFTPTA